MPFTGFPTQEAIDVAASHCSRGAKYTHEECAKDIHEAGLHIDDWSAAVRQIAPATDENEIEQVWWYYGDVGKQED